MQNNYNLNEDELAEIKRQIGIILTHTYLTVSQVNKGKSVSEKEQKAIDLLKDILDSELNDA